MITNSPIFSTMHQDYPKRSHYDKASAALDMARGILGVLSGATDPDENSREVYAGDVTRAVDAARFLAEMAQEHIDSLHGQLLSTGNEVAHEGIS